MNLKSLNKKQWKKVQKFVKETDEKSTKDTLGVSFYTAEFFINENGKITNRVKGAGLFDERQK